MLLDVSLKSAYMRTLSGSVLLKKALIADVVLGGGQRH
jgi:hypothetical protein